MSSPVLPHKRRRLNDATQQLRKPFVSPLRASHVGQAEQSNKPNSKETTEGQSAPLIQQDTTTPGSSYSTPVARRPQIRPTPTSRLSLTPYSLASHGDPEETEARRAVAALETRIRQVRKDLDVLRQARQISASKQHAELPGLTEKWRSASQAAAEELFGTVKERVCRMGGVAAWRETERRKRDRNFGFGGEEATTTDHDDDADCEFDSQGEELSDAEQEYRKKVKRQARREALDAAEPADQVDVESADRRAAAQLDQGEDDDSFTMDMMLRSLNIELDVIGFDKQAQRWITSTDASESEIRVDSQQDFSASFKAVNT